MTDTENRTVSVPPAAPEPLRHFSHRYAFPGESLVLRCVAAFGMMGILGLVRLALDPRLEDRGPFVLLVLGAPICAWLWGLTPGLVSVGVGALSGSYIVGQSLLAMFHNEANFIHFAMFSVTGVLLVVLADLQHRTQISVEEQAAEAQRQRELVQQSEGLLRAMITSLGEAIIAVKTDRNIRFMNPPAEQLTGISQADAVGRPLETVFRWADESGQPEDFLYRWALHGHASTDRLEGYIHHSTGERISTETGYSTIRDQQGNILGAILVFRDITERRRAEANIKASQERFLYASQATAEGFWDWNMITNETEWTDRIYELLGVSPGSEPAAMETWLQSAPEDESDANRSSLAKALEDGRSVWTCEHRLLRRDGSVIYVHDRALILRDELGNPRRLVGSAMEITNRKQAEAEIRKLNESLAAQVAKLETLLDVLPIGIGIASDPDCRDIRVNPTFSAMLNIPYGANASLSADGATVPTNFKIFRDNRELADTELPMQLSAMKGITIRNFEEDLVRTDGVRLHLLACSAPLRDYNGTIIGSVGAFLDITESKRTQAALQQSEAWFRALADSMPPIVWTAARDGDIDYFNERWFAFSGFSREQSYDHQSWRDLIHSVDRIGYVKSWIRAIAKGAPYETEMRLYNHTEKRYQWFLIRARPVHNDTGEILKWFGTFTDIDQRKQDEVNIRKLNERLQRAMAETHHRVKNNLQIISALIEMQLASAHVSVPVTEIQRIKQHVIALAAVHDLLTQETSARNHVESFLTDQIIDKLTPIIRVMLGDRDFKYEADSIELPLRYATSLAVIINELVTNAIKHGQGSVTLSLRASDGIVQLEVWNAGKGFPEGFDALNSSGKGIELITHLAKWDLSGQLSFRNVDGGATVVLIFPQSEAK